MGNRRSTLFIVALTALVLQPAVSRAETLTFVFEGKVSGLVTDPPGLPNFAQMDDPVRFEFTFDSTAPNGSSVPWAGGYTGESAELRVGASDYVCALPGIIIQHPSDLFRVQVSLLPESEWLGGSTYFALADQEQSDALQSIALPLAPYALEPFAQTQFSVALWGPPKWGGGYDSVYQAYGEITAFYAIPEPLTLSMFGFGIATWVPRRSRRATRL